MRLPRGLILPAGTLAILGVCYAIAAPISNDTVGPQISLAPRRSEVSQSELTRRCEFTAERVREQNREWKLLIRAPYVLAGDLSAEQLNELHRDVILPTVRALEVDYFDCSPTEPVVVVALAADENYRSALERLGHSRRAEYSGLYQREERTIWLNLSTGVGTLSHELTHALAHADFPQMPEWFDEGLASLHEEADFSADGLHLVGQENWRRRFLEEAIQHNCWKPLDRLLAEPFARSDVAALEYAMSRYVCVYLQERGLLSAFYRKCRSRIDSDPTGQAALLSLFPGMTIAELDRDFRQWLQGTPSK